MGWPVQWTRPAVRISAVRQCGKPSGLTWWLRCLSRAYEGSDGFWRGHQRGSCPPSPWSMPVYIAKALPGVADRTGLTALVRRRHLTATFRWVPVVRFNHAVAIPVTSTYAACNAADLPRYPCYHRASAD